LKRVAVVGSGPSGLAALKVLTQFGFDTVAFEAGDRVGGQWVLGNASGTSAAYRSLRTNTHKGMSRFSDFELPKALPDFPSHEQMAAWFESYAKHFRVLDRIRFGVRVTRARPLEAGCWQVETEAGDGGRFDALVAATGNLWDPRWPELAESFSGERLHAKDYLDPVEPVDCRGRRVLVVGLGNTACELAVELAGEGAAADVMLSARSGQMILPRRVNGKLLAPPHPSDPLGPPVTWLPPRLRDAVFARILPRVFERMLAALPRPEDVGLPAPPTDIFSKRSVINDDILSRIRAGAIRVKPAIRGGFGREVAFVDGTTEPVDVVLAATGYHFTLPFLSGDVQGADGDDARYYRGVMHPSHPTLFVVGVMRALCSIWPRSEQQAHWIAHRLRDDIALPSPERRERDAYPILRVPFGNCQFHAHDLRCDLPRRLRRAWGTTP